MKNKKKNISIKIKYIFIKFYLFNILFLIINLKIIKLFSMGFIRFNKSSYFKKFKGGRMNFHNKQNQRITNKDIKYYSNYK